MISPRIMDPMQMAEVFWPDVTFYKQQREIIYSVRDNDETVAVAGNMLGKDFVAGFIAIWFFLTRHPCKIVTTSAKDQHLDVLWGEIGNFIQTSKIPLTQKEGGPLIVNHRMIRKVVNGEVSKKTYLTGMVASPDSIASMQGHHLARPGGVPHTLFLCDEASSVPDDYHKMASTWFHRAFIFGNPWPCANFFYKSVKGNPQTKDPGGDVPRDSGVGYYRKVFQIKAIHSPNVLLALAQKRKGEEPSGEILIPGVKSYSEYIKNRKMWDKIQQCVSLDGDFYEGSEVKLFPPGKLREAATRAAELGTRRKAKSLGIDPAEGGDNSVWTGADELGLVEQRVKKTRDTSIIVDDTIQFMREYDIKPENVVFDRGGGGKEHADRMRRMGYNVRTVAFGESVKPERKRGLTTMERKKMEDEERYTYFNRRAEMYGLLSLAVENGYAIPIEMAELHRQLSLITRDYDPEGRLKLPPKNKPPNTNSTAITLIDVIGHSPDEADSAVLAYYALIKKSYVAKAGAIT